MSIWRALIFVPFLAMAGCQLVTVQVLDDSDGRPLAGAAVSYKQAGGGEAKSLGKTDDEGDKIFIEPRKIESLMVHKEGYKDFTGNYERLKDRAGQNEIRVRLVPTGMESSGADEPIDR